VAVFVNSLRLLHTYADTTQDFTLQQEILYTWTNKPRDWRTWNLGRTRAYQAIEAYTQSRNISDPDTANLTPR
jgi:hypothetical protein